ncbi:IS1 family transposase [Desulfobulbus sp. TB]|nr:IS1 family transposase [Desulfobulbus sp. TB]
MICPECDSENIVKNGVKENGKQNHLCLICKRQFVENPSGHYRISEEKRSLVDRLLLEKIPLAGIVRAAQVSERWLQYYINDLYENVSEKLTVLSKKKGA